MHNSDECYICGHRRSEHIDERCPTAKPAGDNAAVRLPCGICDEPVLRGPHGIFAEYHDCKPVPGARLIECQAELSKAMALAVHNYEAEQRALSRVTELERALAESGALVQTTSLHEQAARAEMQKTLALNHDLKIAVQHYGAQRDEANRCMVVASGKAALATKERDAASAELAEERQYNIVAHKERDEARAELATAQKQMADYVRRAEDDIRFAREQRDEARVELAEEQSIRNRVCDHRDQLVTTAQAALSSLMHEWPQHALWREKSPEAEPIRRLADAAGMDLVEGVKNHGDIEAKLVQGAVFMPVLAEISRALTKFPTWPTDPLHAMAVLGEEYGELNKAILQEVYEPHKQDRTAVRTEAVQCAAMAMRFLTSIDAYRFDRCEQHRQEVKDA